MIFQIFFNNFNYFFNIVLNFSEEFIVLIIIYNFIKLIIIGSIVELILPTHYFNKKNNINNNLKFRNYTETLLKLRPIEFKKNVFNNSFINFFLLKLKKKKNFK